MKRTWDRLSPLRILHASSILRFSTTGTVIRTFEIVKIILIYQRCVIYPSSSKNGIIYRNCLSTRILQLSYFQTNFHAWSRSTKTRIVSFQINPIKDLLQLDRNARAQLESSHRREYKFPSKQAVAKKEGARRAVSIRNPSPWREITRPRFPPFPRCFYTRKGRVAIFMSSAARGKTFSGEIGAEMGRDWRGWRAVKRVSLLLLAATETLLFSSLLFFALLFDTRVCQLLFHSSPFVSRPWSVFKADTLRSAPVEKRMQPCCARVEKTGEPCASCCFEREEKKREKERERLWSSLIGELGRVWPLEKVSPPAFFISFSSPLWSTFLLFPMFQTIVSKCGNFQLGGEGLLLHPTRFEKRDCWMERKVSLSRW